MDEKKPRMTEMRVAFDGPVTIAEMSPPGEVIQFIGVDRKVLVPSHIEIGQVYDRNNGKRPKVVSRVLADPFTIEPDLNKSLGRFSSILAVDTNTREIRGHRVSVAVVCHVTDIVVATGEWSAKVHAQHSLEFRYPREPPEHIGWLFAMHMIAASPIPRPVGLVVDSDLDGLTAMNKRERPFMSNQILPDGITLIYASSDTGKDLIGNKAIGICDADARRILRMIETGYGTVRPIAVPSSLPCEHMRIWPPLSPPTH